MGIPAFYRWLVDRYPLSVVEVVQEAPKVINGVTVPVDTSLPNPNGVEFDNLYLDMNGIIHPCFHPEDQPSPNSYEEVYKAVFKYIDHIFSLIRPRKLLFMAVDGVAPRAKMNQQRARRFRAAADATAVAEKPLGWEVEDFELKESNKLDSNVITPGTEFMASLSAALRYYILLRLNNDPGWRGIKVILSDANVPGEGEHKIAAYIRSQRHLPGFDPNTRHCLYGLDADLIMLALATHEIHFSILREDVRVVRRKEKIAKFGRNGKFSIKGKDLRQSNEEVSIKIPQKFQFLNIWVLRDYLQHDLRIPGAAMKIDLERFIDDFVFICLFVGNDFLPHVPSLDIHEGAIDLLMNVYRKEFNKMGGYLTNSFKVDLERVEHFLQVVGSHENAIFRRRCQIRKEKEIQFGASSTMMESGMKKASNSTRSFQKSANTSSDRSNGTLLGIAINDQVRLGEEGWKERYYAEKFEVKTEDDRVKLKRHAVLKYIEGICWVMHYYYQGVCSWQWFYPYHYAPFASDFLDLKHLTVNFTLGVPFKPFDQLMGVLPAASAHALPLSFRNLMTDPLSSIIDFYPSDFALDLNGKRFSWQAVCKLPFVEESRLLAETRKVEHTLTDDEKQRNSWALDALFVHISHPLASKITSFYLKKKDHPKLAKAKLKRKLDPNISGGMNGYMYVSAKTIRFPEVYSPVGGMGTITKNKAIFVFYKNPPIQMHIPRIPDGAVLPKKSIRKQDVQPAPVLWHERSALCRRVYSLRPISNSITGSHLSKMAHQLVSDFYHKKRRRSNPDEIVHHAIDGSCHRGRRIVEQEMNQGTKSNGRIPGKRKQRDVSHQEKTVEQEMNRDGDSHSSSLGKRKRGGRRRTKAAQGEMNCDTNRHDRSAERTNQQKNHDGNSNNSTLGKRKRRDRRKRKPST